MFWKTLAIGVIDWAVHPTLEPPKQRSRWRSPNKPAPPLYIGCCCSPVLLIRGNCSGARETNGLQSFRPSPLAQEYEFQLTRHKVKQGRVHRLKEPVLGEFQRSKARPPNTCPPLQNERWFERCQVTSEAWSNSPSLRSSYFTGMPACLPLLSWGQTRTRSRCYSPGLFQKHLSPPCRTTRLDLGSCQLAPSGLLAFRVSFLLFNFLL